MIPLIISVTISAIGILNAVLFWFMPRLTRHDLYFAVTVAPGFRDDPEGKSILRRYRTELVLVSALALTAVVIGLPWLGVGFVPDGFFLQLVAAFIAFYRARQRVLPHAVPPTAIREAELNGGSRIIPGGGWWRWGRSSCLLLAPRTCGFTGTLAVSQVSTSSAPPEFWAQWHSFCTGQATGCGPFIPVALKVHVN